MFRQFGLSLTALVWATVFSTFVMAQQANQPPAQPTTPPAADADAAVGSTEPQPLREQTIYVPYQKLQEKFEREGRGVFLPYEQFQQLWKQARAKYTPPVTAEPPAPVLLTQATSEATVDKDVVRVRAKIQLEVLRKGWHRVPLRLGDAAILNATLDGQTARLITDPKQGHVLLIEGTSDESRQAELELEYAKAYEKTPGRNSVSFQAPQAPINRWQITIPERGVKVSVHPMIAATESVPPPAPSESEEPAPEPPPEPASAEPAPGPATSPEPDQTVLKAFVGAAPEVRIDWTPKAEGAAGLEALASVQAEQQVVIEEGVIRTAVLLSYTISRAELPSMEIQIPADQKVAGVFDPNIRRWRVEPKDDHQTILVELFQPAQGKQDLRIELERFTDVVMLQNVSVPVVQAVGVSRQQGIVAVRLAGELQAQVERRAGLLQLGTDELPPQLKQTQWPFAYRYATLPFDLALRVEKVEPQIRTEQLAEVYLEPQQIRVSLLAVFDIQRAGVFQLDWEVPADWRVSQVRGFKTADAEPVAVDTYHVEGDETQQLKVDLSRKAMGRVAMLVQLHRPLSDPNLLSPTGEVSELSIQLPRVTTPLEQTVGHLVVYGPESLRINPRSLTGLRTVSFEDAYKSWQSALTPPGNLRRVQAMTYSQDPLELVLNVERRRPYVSVRQLLAAKIESGVVRYNAQFFYEIRYSSVKSLRIDVPEDLASEIRNATPNIREATMEPQPDDVAEGYTAWEFTGERELLGNVTIHLTWEFKGDELEIGKSAVYEIPALQPANVDRSWGQVVISKTESLDVQPEAGYEGLRPIDPQHDLMSGANIPDAALAFEFHGAWSLSVKATRYELQDVKRTSIERTVVRLVVTRGNRVAVQALFRMRSTVQRLAVRLPEEAEFDTDPLRINGQPVALERGDKEERYIPLVGQDPDEPMLVDLRYTIAGDFTRLDIPWFPDMPPVQSMPAMQKAVLCVYLPEELTILRSSGPWHRYFDNWLAQWAPAEQTRRADSRWIEWVKEDVSLANDTVGDFPTDGRLYIFTTIQPPPPPEGSLQLVAVAQNWLNTVVFAVLAVVGLLFLRARALTKLCLILLLVIAVALVGAFAPQACYALLQPRLFIGYSLLALVWVVSLAVPRSRAAPAPPPPEPKDSLRESILEGTPFQLPGESEEGEAEPAESPDEPSAESGETKEEDKNSEGGSNDG